MKSHIQSHRPARLRPLVKRQVGRSLLCAMPTCATAPALILSPIQTVQAHFETATFEALPHGATAFQLSRVEFLLSDDLSVQDGEELFGFEATYGSDGSARWFRTPLTPSTGELAWGRGYR